MGLPGPPGWQFQVAVPFRWTSPESLLGRWAPPGAPGTGSLTPGLAINFASVGSGWSLPCACLLGQLLIKSLQSPQCLTWPVTAPGLMHSVLETLDPESS